MQLSGRASVFVDRTFGRWVYPVHEALIRRTGGRIGSHYAGGRVVLLTTTGRRSGQPRTHALLSYPHGDDWLVVGSNGGRQFHPAWYHNLRAQPEAGLQVGPRRFPVRAEIAQGPERDELWEYVTSRYRGYAHYQTLTDRQLPVVRLRPA